MEQFTKREELSKAISDLKLMGISSIITHDNEVDTNTFATTVKFFYTVEEEE